MNNKFEALTLPDEEDSERAEEEVNNGSGGSSSSSSSDSAAAAAAAAAAAVTAPDADASAAATTAAAATATSTGGATVPSTSSNKELIALKKDAENQKPVEPGAGEHRLQYNYSFWFSKKSPGKSASQSYDQNLKRIGSFASVEQFWGFYSHMVRPSELTGHCDYHLFKEGVTPLWEDEANRNGGKWIIRLKKGVASRCWELLIMAMLGEQLMLGEEVCGAVVSLRYQEDILSLWNRTACEQFLNTRVRDTLRRVLNLPPNTVIEYKSHNDSLKDNSSYRNTGVI